MQKVIINLSRDEINLDLLKTNKSRKKITLLTNDIHCKITPTDSYVVYEQAQALVGSLQAVTTATGGKAKQTVELPATLQVSTTSL